MGNTGNKITLTLKLHNITQDTYPGDTKPNLPGDPDYIPPTEDFDACPVDQTLSCPLVKGGVAGVGVIQFTLSLPESVIANPDMAKLEVRLYNNVPALVQTKTFTVFDPNYFEDEFTGLDNDETYTIDLVYKNSEEEIIHTCPSVAEIPLHPDVSWEGIDPFCITIPSCEDGWTYNADTNTCQMVDEEPAIPPSSGGGTPANAAHVTNEQWNQGGGRILAPGYASDGSGTVAANLITPHFWVNGNFQWDTPSRNTTDGRMNWAGVWVAGETSDPTDEWIGFVRRVDTPVAKTVYVAMCADNQFRFALNGTILVTNLDAYNWNYINIYPVDLLPGSNYIEMWALNTDSVAGMAMEIYDQSFASLAAATMQAHLNVLFSTRDMFGQPFDLGETIGYHCGDPTYSLDMSDPDNPKCVKIENDPPILNNTGIKGYANRERLADGVPDGFTEENTEVGGEGPYIEPIEDLEACPLPEIFVEAFVRTFV